MSNTTNPQEKAAKDAEKIQDQEGQTPAPKPEPDPANPPAKPAKAVNVVYDGTAGYDRIRCGRKVWEKGKPQEVHPDVAEAVLQHPSFQKVK